MIPTPKLKKMRAFHNDPQLKKDMVAEVLKHQQQDQIIKNTYGTNNGKWKGCAVGCSIHSYNIQRNKDYKTNDHEVFEEALGIPKSLAKLEDFLFKYMPNDKSLKFPAEFLKAIPVGANLSLVAPKFIASTLRELVKDKNVKSDKTVVKAILDVVILWDRVINGKPVESAEWRAAFRAAKSAAKSAGWSVEWNAALSAGWNAVESAALSASLSAEWSVAWSVAESAAKSAAESAAEIAARSVSMSVAWSVAEIVARNAARRAAAYKMSRRLLKIFRSSK